MLREIDFLVQNVLIDSLFISPVESSYFNTNMCKFEPSQKEAEPWQSADPSKV